MQGLCNVYTFWGEKNINSALMPKSALTEIYNCKLNVNLALRLCCDFEDRKICINKYNKSYHSKPLIMTLEKVYPNQKKGTPASILKFLQSHNPYPTVEALFNKAGFTKAEIAAFIEKPDTISFRHLNRLLSICEIDLKLTMVDSEDLDEIAEEQLSDIFINEDDSLDALDWDEESEEDVHWI